MSFTLTCQQQEEDIFINEGLQRGVQGEIDALDKVLGDKYGFQTETYLIPSKNSHQSLERKIHTFKTDYGKRENLLLVYYGGHANKNKANLSVWVQ